MANWTFRGRKDNHSPKRARGMRPNYGRGHHQGLSQTKTSLERKGRHLLGIAKMATLLSKHTRLLVHHALRERKREDTGYSSGKLNHSYSTTLEVCEQRDVRGLYAKARSGEISISLVFRIHSVNPSAPTSHSILAGKTVTRWMIWWTS